MQPSEMPKRLAAFDFDLTIVMENTDIIVRSLIDPSKITPEIDLKLNPSLAQNWTAHMQAVFNVLHENYVQPKQVVDIISGMSEVPGMIQLIRELAKNSFDVIIISDSNSVFIRKWCETNDILNCIKQIYTNPAKFTDNGLLLIEPYHWQTECQLSAKNLCKGKVLEQYLAETKSDGICYESVYYIGDGRNDYCPVLRLNTNDFGCAKIGLYLDKRLNLDIQKEDTVNGSSRVAATIIRWENGYDLQQKIMESIKNAKH